jgi:regulator of protease activity HflC (stomatin/prohibitin superfamily)
MNHHNRGAGEVAGIGFLALLILGVILTFSSCTVISPGQAGVQVTMGTVDDHSLGEGTHWLNPFSGVHIYNTQQRTWKEEKVSVPSQDQLMTQMDISVQYRIIPAMAPTILRETGDEEKLITVHLEPKLRSLLREIGKEVPHAEDFFTEAIQSKIQNEIMEQLSAYCKPKGLEIQAILLRDMQLPAVIQQAVQSKKEREQLAIRQQSELQRFTTEQQQKIATAEAEKKSAELKADQTRIEASAEAFKIKTINDAASTNPVYVQLQALKTLGEMAKDPATKLYFINGQSTTPLPLLHMSDVITPEGTAKPAAPAKVEK